MKYVGTKIKSDLRIETSESITWLIPSSSECDVHLGIPFRFDFLYRMNQTIFDEVRGRK